MDLEGFASKRTSGEQDGKTVDDRVSAGAASAKDCMGRGFGLGFEL